MHDDDDDDRGSIISIIEDRARSSNRSFLLRCQVSPGSEGHRLGGRPRPQWPIGHPQTIRPVTPLGCQGLSWLLARSSKVRRRKPKLKKIPSKLEVAPLYVKCQSGLDGWMDTLWTVTTTRAPAVLIIMILLTAQSPTTTSLDRSTLAVDIFEIFDSAVKE